MATNQMYTDIESSYGPSLLPQSNLYLSDPSYYQNIQQNYAYDAFMLGPAWGFPSREYTSYATPTSPPFLPIQNPSECLRESQVAPKPQPPGKKGGELVAMGLYDDKNGSMFASLDAIGNGASGLRDSLGKGLKLEEAWEPPIGEDREAEDADEGYSTDDAEEELPVAPASEEAQPQVYPASNDLSNQTFFFESDDQYGNYLSLQHGLHAFASKPPDPVQGNFFWV